MLRTSAGDLVLLNAGGDDGRCLTVGSDGGGCPRALLCPLSRRGTVTTTLQPHMFSKATRGPTTALSPASTTLYVTYPAFQEGTTCLTPSWFVWRFLC